jgi:hypothetical protein
VCVILLFQWLFTGNSCGWKQVVDFSVVKTVLQALVFTSTSGSTSSGGDTALVGIQILVKIHKYWVGMQHWFHRWSLKISFGIPCFFDSTYKLHQNECSIGANPGMCPGTYVL